MIGRAGSRLRGRRGALTAAAAAVSVAAVVAGVVLLTRGDHTARPAAQAPLPHSTVQPAPTGTGPTAGAPHGPTPGTSASAAGGTSAPAAPIPLAASSLAIPSLSVRAGIVDATVDNGVLEPPRNASLVGRWTGSAGLSASSGMVTIAGHVNWVGMGTFAFARLADIRPGAVVYTAAADGTEQAWRVTSVSARAKSSGIDPAAFGGPTAPRSLVLVTCGGTFDTSARSYENNVYVYARPVPLTA